MTAAPAVVLTAAEHAFLADGIYDGAGAVPSDARGGAVGPALP